MTSTLTSTSTSTSCSIPIWPAVGLVHPTSHPPISINSLIFTFSTLQAIKRDLSCLGISYTLHDHNVNSVRSLSPPLEPEPRFSRAHSSKLAPPRKVYLISPTSGLATSRSERLYWAFSFPEPVGLPFDLRHPAISRRSTLQGPC